MFDSHQDTAKDIIERRKKKAFDKLHGKLYSLQMLIGESPKEIRTEMKKRVVDAMQINIKQI
jgi:hypothetical protein